MPVTISKKAAIAIAIITLIIGLGIGYGIGYYTTKKAAPPQTPTTGAVTKKWTVYFIPHAGPSDPFWACQMKAAQAAAAICPGLDLKFVAPEKYGIKEQVELIEAAIAKHPDFLIVTISDAKAMDPVLRKAISEGIPVLAVNIPDYRPADQRIPYLGYVGQDETISGKILAEAALKRFKALTGRLPKRVVVGIHQPGLICLELRTKGIMEVCKEYGVPCERLDITMNPSQVMAILKSYLTKHPDTEIIFTLGPCGSDPCIKMIEEQGLKGKVYNACFDLSPTVIKGIKDGVTLCAISQQPAAQAFYSVITAYLYLKYGILPPKDIPTGPTVVDKSNIQLIEKQIQTTGGA